MHIEVADTGIGIKAKDLKRLFKSFGKLEDTQQINKNGCGLGLNISRRIVQSMNGQIHVESKVNRGTTFKMYIFAGIKNPNFIPDDGSQTRMLPAITPSTSNN